MAKKAVLEPPAAEKHNGEPPLNGTLLTPEEAAIAFPLVPIDEGAYRKTHVDLQLSGRQALGLRALFEGLDRAGARLENGRRVSTPTDAVRFLLEQAAKKYDESVYV